LDLEFPVLQARPQVLDAVMEVIPWMPWARLTTLLVVLGGCWSAVKLARAIAVYSRPAGDQIGGMVNLELKINVLLRRSEALMHQGIVAALQETTTHVSHQDAVSAKLSLMRGLSMLRNATGEDPQLSAMTADNPLRRRILRLLEECSTEAEASAGFCEAWARCDILGAALRGDWVETVRLMVEVLEGCRSSSSAKAFGVDLKTRCGGGQHTPRAGLRRRDNNYGGS